MTATHVSIPDGTPASLLANPMTLALLQEMLGKLTALAQGGPSDRIDLRRLPLPRGALEALRTWLGRGEIEANVRALGTTTITETAIAGVWWVRQAKADGAVVGEKLESSLCPHLLMADGDDAKDGAAQLKSRIDSLAQPSMTSMSLPSGSADPG